MKVEAGTPSDVEQLVEKDVMDVLPPDVLLLYWTLVRDGVVPGGLEWQFASFQEDSWLRQSQFSCVAAPEAETVSAETAL